MMMLEAAYLRAIGLPEQESNEEYRTQDERRQNMGASPAILVTTPLHPLVESATTKEELSRATHSHEQDHADNTKDPTNIVDLRQDLFARHTGAVDPWWREVEDGCHDESDEVPTEQKGRRVSSVFD